MNDTLALKVTDVRKKYPKGTEALKGVSLAIKQGEFFGLLGPNGAGKTTLISIISHLVTKSEGEVTIAGISIDQDPDAAKASIGLVPQEFNFDIFKKVIDTVVDQAGYYGIPRPEARARAEGILTKLGLWEKRNEQARALSGGMKRRLLIARALIHDPKVLLLDEPTAGVDVELRRGMWEYLRELNESGVTIVLTTHYLEEAEQLCNRIAIINKGEIIEQGSVKELLSKLNFVTMLLDTVDPLTEATMQLIAGYPLTRVDDNTLKLELKPGETANDAFRKLTSVGVQITNVRNEGSRLEEVFVNLIKS
ncbi:MAG TPA: ABC transporter ATP-binding protein [Candidatus Paceibacterota bacterium]|nr:ABC transporter ATP-binding protein [Candidatus Paceibacterota bacterium]